jgi:alginate O-acetyltransferase complex protein AlgI
VILADGVAPLAGLVFDQLDAPGLCAAWTGVLSYAMQIYFDFSGYSDMAIGLGLLLGFEFPQNFDSPYKSLSITEFWRRWHISLSSWLRDYLYIPLGGNRRGPLRTYFNLFVTMLLGGLWHGANWTFLVWGGYHGILLALERAAGKRGLLWWLPRSLQKWFTFVLVLFGWVLFRCKSLEKAGSIFAGMLGLRGWGGGALNSAGFALALVVLPIAWAIAWWCPNTWELLRRQEEETQTKAPDSVPQSIFVGVMRGFGLAALFVVAVGVILINSSSPFLYFQF